MTERSGTNAQSIFCLSDIATPLTLADLYVREAPGGVTIRGEFIPGISVEDVRIESGGIFLANVPAGAEFASADPATGSKAIRSIGDGL